MSEPILKVNDLCKSFPVYGPLGRLAPPKSNTHAVSNVSFHLNEGEVYGLVGESGSGKTTTGRAILRLISPDAGEVFYNQQNLAGLSEKEFRAVRKDIQMIFQDPYSSLNPRKRIGTILEEPLIIQKIGDKKQRQEKVFEILRVVGLQPEHYYRFPHEFSGGQRQRLGIARALIVDPRIIICDEPVSALDVSIQAQILNLLRSIQKDRKMALVFITHDISVVRHISDRIGVMYAGSIVEEAQTDALFANPLHPYTRALFAAVPNFHSHGLSADTVLKGELPAQKQNMEGCPFRARCPEAKALCNCKAPVPKAYGNHHVLCHFAAEPCE